MNKGVWWMPRHVEQKKDAANGETRRGVVSTHRSVGLRMGKLSASNVALPMSEYIAHEERTQGIETS